jgi:hypothetical protein
LPALKSLGQVVFLLAILLGSIAFGLALQSSVVVPSTGSIYYPPEAKILLEDDFESGDFSVWNGTFTTSGNNTASVASTNPYEGVYHSYFQTDSLVSGVNYAYCYEVLSPTISEVYARGYFKIIDGLPLVDDNDRFGFISYEVGGWLQCSFRVLRSGGVDRFNIVGYNDGSSVTKSSDAVYPVEGKWYCFEFFIKVHPTRGEYRVWINGVEQITMRDLNTAKYGTGVSRVRFGLTYTANVQHCVKVYCDSVVVSTRYVGQLRYTFGVIGSVIENPTVRNFYWLFGNQSISYRAVLPSEVERFEDVDRFDGLVVWTRGNYGYNATAIRLFARTHIVISDVWDFCNTLYPSLYASIQVMNTGTVTYVRDWGNFRNGDLVEMRNETGNTNQLATVLSSGLTSFSNVTAIARYDANNIALFHMNGTTVKSGFYVMGLDATTPETEWAGIWHVFPAIKMVKDFPTGRYARWLANGINHLSYDEVMSRLNNWVASAPTGMNASVMRIGKSVLGRDINATRFGRGSRYIIVNGAIHGDEKNTVPALLRLLEVIQENFEANGCWKNRLDEVSLIVIPILNPDGYVSNTRENANGKDLNRQFPPGSTTTEPEAWALRWLWGNYSTFVYIDLHEGRYWYPNDYCYALYLPTNPVDIKAFSIQNCYWTADDFQALHHWGYYTENGLNVNIGKVRTVGQSFTNNTAYACASYFYNISGYLMESLAWSPAFKARQMLWAMDFYISTVLGIASHFDRLRADDFLVVTQGNVKSLVWTSPILHLAIDTSNHVAAATFTTKIDVGDRPKPLHVFIDNQEKSEGNGWTYSNGIISITGAQNSVEIRW